MQPLFLLLALAAATTAPRFTPCTGSAAAEAPVGPGNSDGPWSSRIRTAISGDGLKFKRAAILELDQADVPCALVDTAGVLRLYYITWCAAARNRIICAETRDLKSWTCRVVTIRGVERNWGPPCDPTVLQLDDGRFRIYFTTKEPGEREPSTHSAISQDDVTFTLEPGRRYTSNRPVLDPSVLRAGDTWILFAGGGQTRQGNHRAVSPDGFNFSSAGDFDGHGLILANGLAVPGGYRYYAFTQNAGEERRIRSLFSRDGMNWILESGDRLVSTTADTRETGGVKDPSVVRLPDGRYLMFYATQIPGAQSNRPKDESEFPAAFPRYPNSRQPRR